MSPGGRNTTTTPTTSPTAKPNSGSLRQELKLAGTSTTHNNHNHNNADQLQQSTAQPGVPILNSGGFDIDFNPRRYHAYTRPRHHVTDLIVAEDNEAVIKIIKKCRSTALRHLPRTHSIDVTWLFEVCGAPEICVRYCNTKQQVADLMTKVLNSPPVWEHLLDIAQIRAGPVPTPAAAIQPIQPTTQPQPNKAKTTKKRLRRRLQ